MPNNLPQHLPKRTSNSHHPTFLLGRLPMFAMAVSAQPHSVGVHERPQLAADSVRAADVAATETLRGDAGGVAAAAIGGLQPGHGTVGGGCLMDSAKLEIDPRSNSFLVLFGAFAGSIGIWKWKLNPRNVDRSVAMRFYYCRYNIQCTENVRFHER